MAFSFKGGIHPRYAKELAAGAAIEDVPPPREAVIPLSQHLGAPAKACVAKGDKVLVGQRIGEPAGFVSVPVHAPISGTVKDVGLQPHPFGTFQEAVVIEADGEDKLADLVATADPLALGPDEIKQKIKDAGVVGMGGAAFPTHVKLSPPAGKRIDTVLLNGAECEPYLTADDRLMQEQPEKVVSGFRIVMKALGVKEGVIGIEENKPEARRAIEGVLAKGAAGVRVASLHVKYPQGGEKQLISAILGREVPSGGLPMDVGVVVQNVATCTAVDDAVRLGCPLLSRITTVTGEGVTRPCNLNVRLGTPVTALLEKAGGFKGTPGRVILGGPMMGIAAPSVEVPVIKSTGGVLVFGRDQLPDVRHQACIRCGRCVRVCPMGLCPNEQGLYAEVEQWEVVVERDVKDCIECGCCAYTCPANRPLVQWFRYAKLWDRQRAQAQAQAQKK